MTAGPAARSRRVSPASTGEKERPKGDAARTPGAPARRDAVVHILHGNAALPSTGAPRSARVRAWGGGGVADLQPLHIGRRPERAGLQARLRSLFAAPGWGRRIEPRTRYGEPFLPGLPALGRQHVGDARALLERAEAVRGRRFKFFGRGRVSGGHRLGAPRGGEGVGGRPHNPRRALLRGGGGGPPPR